MVDHVHVARSKYSPTNLADTPSSLAAYRLEPERHRSLAGARLR